MMWSQLKFYLIHNNDSWPQQLQIRSREWGHRLVVSPAQWTRMSARLICPPVSISCCLFPPVPPHLLQTTITPSIVVVASSNLNLIISIKWDHIIPRTHPVIEWQIRVNLFAKLLDNLWPFCPKVLQRKMFTYESPSSGEKCLHIISCGGPGVFSSILRVEAPSMFCTLNCGSDFDESLVGMALDVVHISETSIHQ